MKGREIMKKIRLMGRSLLALVVLAGIAVPSTIAIADTVETTNTSITETLESADTATTGDPQSPADSVASSETSSTSSLSEDSGSSQAVSETEPSVNQEATTVPVQLLGINDFHGALSTTGRVSLGSETHENAGTAALLAGHLDHAEAQFEAANPNAQTFRVQSGDMVGASPANSGLLQDQPTMKILNQMGFDVGTLGNHEFDEGLAEFNRILLGQKPEPGKFYDIVYEYNERHSPDDLKGNFDLVIANVVDNAGNIPYNWQPYTVKSMNIGEKEVKVGFIGIVTTEVPSLVLREHHIDYTFLDPAETIAAYSQELKRQNVEAIVVLAHTSSEQSETDSVSGESAMIMEKVNDIYPENSVDAYFAGHNHAYTNGLVGNTRIVQSTSQGRGYIDLQGEIDLESGDFVEPPTATVNPVIPKEGIDPDPAIQEIVDEADELVAEVTEKKIGTAATAEDISRSTNDLGESPLGNLITDGQVFMAKLNGIDADFAMTNNGGIRADLSVGSDKSITWGAAQTVQPFGNIMQIVEMTGSQIRQVLNQQTLGTQVEGERGYFLQVAGLKYTVTDNPDVTDLSHRYIVHEMTKMDGTPIEEDGKYNVVINDFLFGGGDGFTGFREAVYKDAMQPDTETFVGYIETLEAMGKKIAASIEDRKVYKSAEQIEAEAIEKIKAATTFEKVTEADNLLRGKTIAGAEIVVGIQTRAKSAAKEVVSDIVGEDGSFQLNITSLQASVGDQLRISVTSEGYTADFTAEILAAETADSSTTEPSDTTDSSDSSDLTTDESGKDNSDKDPSKDGPNTDDPKKESDDNKKLPQTGESQRSWIVIAGFLLLGTGGYLIYRKTA